MRRWRLFFPEWVSLSHYLRLFLHSFFVSWGVPFFWDLASLVPVPAETSNQLMGQWAGSKDQGLKADHSVLFWYLLSFP